MEQLLSAIPSQLSATNGPYYFLGQLEKNHLFSKIIAVGHISDSDLEGFCCEREGPNEFCIFGFSLPGVGFFNTVSVLTTRFGSIIELITFDTSYFDNSGQYFGMFAHGRSTGSYYNLKEKHVVKSKRVKRVSLYGKQIDCSIHKCLLYGCKIMISVQ